jgi:hypothetical protein
MGLAISSITFFDNFERYLHAQKRRNANQILCYARKYAAILETGEASILVSLTGPQRRHAMESLTVLSKYAGCYDRWQTTCKHYSLKWTNGNESLQALERFFNPQMSLDHMLQWVRQAIAVLPCHMGEVIRFNCLTGLRPSEAVESVRLINQLLPEQKYYNPERQCLEHFRFPEIFLRRTKKAYISFIMLDNLQPIANLGRKTQHTLRAMQSALTRRHLNTSPTLNSLKMALKHRHLSMQLKYCRKIYASWLHRCGISSDLIDMLQGRIGKNIFLKHYLTPSADYKAQVLQALETLQCQL